MRLRFSLRLLFVVVALSAFALYGLFVRPTVLAERFVDAVQQRDFATADSLLAGNDFWAFKRPPNGEINRIYAEVMPRQWSDIWRFQRRIILRVVRREDKDGGHVEWTEDTDVVAGIRSLKIVYADSDGRYVW